MPKSKEHKNARDRERRKEQKKKGKRFTIRKSSGDLVAIQIAVRVSKFVTNAMRRNKIKLSRQLVESMIRHKAETSRGQWNGTYVEGAHEGDDPPGIHLAIIRWKNPDRLADEDSGWRYANPDSSSEQADAWGSLRRIIQVAPLGIRIDR